MDPILVNFWNNKLIRSIVDFEEVHYHGTMVRVPTIKVEKDEAIVECPTCKKKYERTSEHWTKRLRGEIND